MPTAALNISGTQEISGRYAHFFLTQTPVTAVTDHPLVFGETCFVNMVRRAGTKALFEPGDTRQQWKGEAAASLV